MEELKRRGTTQKNATGGVDGWCSDCGRQHIKDALPMIMLDMRCDDCREKIKNYLNDRGLPLTAENLARAKRVAIDGESEPTEPSFAEVIRVHAEARGEKTLEEIVREHKQSPKFDPHNLLVIRCKNTGELGTLRHFAERIVAAAPPPQMKLHTAVARLSYAVRKGSTYKGLKFERVGLAKDLTAEDGYVGGIEE